MDFEKVNAMKSNNLFILLLTLIFISCLGSDDVQSEDVVDFEVFPGSVLGDGTTPHTIKMVMHPETDINFRKLKIVCTGGRFVGAKEDTPQEIEVTASVLNEEVFAEVKWIAPNSSGTVTISAEPVIQDLAGLFKVEQEVSVDSSEAVKLNLSASTFSVENNFTGEVMISGILKNSTNGGVASGVKIEVVDVFVSDGTDVQGRYRAESLTTGSNSNISIIYTPGNIASGQDIYIIGTTVELNDVLTTRPNLIDTVILQVIESN